MTQATRPGTTGFRPSPRLNVLLSPGVSRPGSARPCTRRRWPRPVGRSRFADAFLLPVPEDLDAKAH